MRVMESLLLLLRILLFFQNFLRRVALLYSQHTHTQHNTHTQRERDSVSPSFVLSLLPTLLVNTVSIPKRE